MAAAEKPEGFQQVGLSVRVLSVDHVDALGRDDAVIFQISVISFYLLLIFVLVLY